MTSPLRRLSAARTLRAVGIVCLAVRCATAQGTGTVGGRVRDGTTDRPVDGVHVYMVGTDLGTLTNAEGRYQFGVRAGDVELRAQRVGYASVTQKVSITPGQVTDVNFELRPAAIGLDAVVVTGTGAQTEVRKLGNTVSTIDASTLRNAPASNVSEQLAARDPAISVLPSGGLAGEGAQIRIRGAASLTQANEPIVYVDGVRVNRGGGFGDATWIGAGGGGTPSRLDDINPEAIDHIEVLKGAAAATLYGTEASAGVIQIFTKKGARGSPQFDFTTEQGVSSFPKSRYEPNFGFARTAAQATALSTFYGMTLQPYQVFGRNVAADQLFETGYYNNYSASVSGGTSAVMYYVNGRYTHDDGPFGNRRLGPANDLDRSAQGSASLVILPASNLKVS